MSGPGCGVRTSSCGWSAIFFQKPRPGLLGRPARCRPALPVHEREPGLLPDCRDGACSACPRRVTMPGCNGQPSARATADAALLKRIKTVHASSRQTYGAPRVHADLHGHGERHSRKRIARLMREAGLVGASHRHGGPTTTRRNKDDRPAPDLVDRDFNAAGPNQLWVADITYVPTMAGFLYLALVLGAWSRKIVGWAMANHLRA